MGSVAKKKDPKLWAKLKPEVTKGGNPGQWSDRKAQLVTQEYKKRGGQYEGIQPEGKSLGTQPALL